MKSLPQIAALYAAIDKSFDSERQDAFAACDSPLAMRIERKQLLNDQAYFVLCWGRLESEINDACRDAIRRRKSDASWESRRGPSELPELTYDLERALRPRFDIFSACFRNYLPPMPNKA